MPSHALPRRPNRAERDAGALAGIAVRENKGTVPSFSRATGGTVPGVARTLSTQTTTRDVRLAHVEALALGHGAVAGGVGRRDRRVVVTAAPARKRQLDPTRPALERALDR